MGKDEKNLEKLKQLYQNQSNRIKTRSQSTKSSEPKTNLEPTPEKKELLKQLYQSSRKKAKTEDSQSSRER